MIGIYKITSPKNMVYIGQSVDIKKRFSAYRRLACKAQPKIYASLLKYGFEKHIFEVITTCERSELNDLERYYQEMYNSCSRKCGLNISYVNTSLDKQVCSEETRLKISNSNKGKKPSKETIDKYKIIFKGSGNPMFGKKHSEAAKQKIREKATGRKMSENAKIALQNYRDKKIPRKMTEETKEKIRVRALQRNSSGENNPFYGKKHTEETKNRLKGRRPHLVGKYNGCANIIFDIASMAFYTTAELSKQFEISDQVFNKRLRNNFLGYDRFLRYKKITRNDTQVSSGRKTA